MLSAHAAASPSRRRKPTAPKDNPSTVAKAELGKLLFFDRRMSLDGTVSCATCHDPKKGWTDQRPTAIGVRQQLGHRNTPTVLNAAYHDSQFWDGRAATMEAQAKVPIANPKEMGLTHDEAARKIAEVKGYAAYFRAAYGDSQVTIDRIAQALGTFQRTILTGNSPYDRHLAGDRAALKADAARGLAIFNDKAKCASCHTGPDLTDGRFHNVGAGMQRRVQDLGRYDVTKKDADRGAFRTPILRNLSDTFPYMHDGSLATLEDVIDFFDRGGFPNPQLSPEIKPLGLSAEEKRDLLSFLGTLAGDKMLVAEPKRLPQ
jgi:cytochrome c peroxidase